jgi:hypothetical protein
MFAGPARILLLVGFFGACAIGPGLLVVRRLPWPPVERLAASFVCSILVVAGGAFAVYLGGLPEACDGALALLGVVAFVACRADLLALWRDPETRAAMTAYGVVAGWMFGWLALIRSYSGGGWAMDWIEQYERVRFFFHHERLDMLYGDMPVPARPPLMNLFCIPFFKMTGAGMMQFQALCALLGSAAVLPAFLIARRVAGDSSQEGRRHPVSIVVLISVLVFNPMLVQNTTYPWTKMLTAVFVSLGVCFYLAAWRGGDAPRLRLAVCSLAAGVLTHYSAAPYALCIAAHFVLHGSRRFPRRGRELAFSGGLAAALLAPWIAWSIATYGAGMTFGGNTTVAGYEQHPWLTNASMAARNVFDTIVPWFLRGEDIGFFTEPGFWGHAREAAFLTYQVNALFMFGSTGWIVLAWYVYRLQAHWERELAVFWALLCASAFTGVAAHPWAAYLGLAHISLQPMAVIGLGIVAGTWEQWTPLLKRIVLAGLSVDLLLGVTLHLLFETRTFGEGAAVTAGLMPGGLRPVPEAPFQNWVEKGHHHFLFIGDVFDPVKWPVLLGLAVFAALLLRRFATIMQVGSRASSVSPAIRAV